ncbi:enoyl-CoA hydratase/isomerase family protein [Acrocarpospora catenulata]|uniref:enoyl-CoA hydratase/isomerase family protein n=1 Tax=Acrocarpospora catenulata TaxID=2836182 RepID=UPI001BDA102E|nr:enoyl-CoA hydratase/isomerase family protein [Acrocarpospora catenulata]
MNEPVLLDVADGVATITLNRPEARNALNMAVKTRLAAVLQEVANDPEVRAVVVVGAGGSFCAGGDIVEMELNDSPRVSRSRLAALLETVFVRLAEMEKPTIAAVEGHAHGAGLSLALACDLMIVSETATLSCAFTKVGLVPDCGSLYFLPRRLPMPVAKELIFTGRRFSGAEAVRLGLANRAVPSGTVAETAGGLALELADAATVALGMAKSLLETSTGVTLRELARLEAFGQAIAYATEDHLTAREAFKAKTTPRFSGR